MLSPLSVCESGLIEVSMALNRLLGHQLVPVALAIVTACRSVLVQLISERMDRRG